jgi:phosphoribosyl 1,2-cyclic phosphodiesterase
MPLSVTFWGVRGTITCPMASHMRYGGNTSCVEVRAGGQCILLDIGSGSRLLGKRLLRDGDTAAVLLLSHTHLDHITGFPYFEPAYRKGFSLRVIAGRHHANPDIETVLGLQMQAPLFPVPLGAMGADLSFEDVEPGEAFDLPGGVRVRTARLNHPDGATGYRLEHGGASVCYVTDTEHVPGHLDRNILTLIEGADLVLYDSTYTEAEYAAGKAGWGHSTWNQGVALCRAAGAKQLALFHHDPDHDDEAIAAIEREAREVWPAVFAAREGETVTLR